MRSAPANAGEVLSGFSGWDCTIQSWRGPTLLARKVPILAGRLVSKVERQGVTERLTITVPRWDGGDDWFPGDNPLHPLADFGQELQVTVTSTSSSTGASWDTRLARVLLMSWEDNGDGTISVTGASRMQRIIDDRLKTPMQPRADGTLVSEARRLLPLGMSASFDAALVDRTCPAGMTWSEDRLAALQEIADAWPARLRTDSWGQVTFGAPLPAVPAPVVTMTDGERGTLARAPRRGGRESRSNEIVVRSSAPGREDVQAVVAQATGPAAASGEYGAVTRFWSSPLIETVAQAEAAGASMLRSNVLTTQTLPVSVVADPRIELDDAVEVIQDAGTPYQARSWGWVTGTDLPLTPGDGLMRVDVGVAL